MPPLDVILFDIGGTLDGRGAWRERFSRLFAECGGVELSHAARMRAFDHAEARSHATPAMAAAGLREMVTRHVGWQLDSLNVEDPAFARALVDRFAADVERATAVNRPVLATLVDQGYRLGAVSNACGNAAVLCEEYGYAGLLSAIVDSHHVGASKPDPAIFRYALEVMHASPRRTAFVGDSLDRDIAPARSLGLRTFWISNERGDAPPGLADAVVESVGQLPARLLELEARPV